MREILAWERWTLVSSAMHRAQERARAFVMRIVRCSSLRRTVLPFLVYAAFIAVLTPPVVRWPIRLAFYAYAGLVFMMGWGVGLSPSVMTRLPSRLERRVFRVLLIGGGIFLILSRLLPFLWHGATPLGYDTGFYLSSIQSAFDGVLTGFNHRNTRILLLLPLEWLGIPLIIYFHGLYVLTQFLVAGSLFALMRTLHTSARVAYGAAAVFLYVVSIPQLFAYWWMYYQTELAIALLLATMTLLFRRSVLAFGTASMGIALHPATFFPFVLAAVAFLIIQLVRSLVRLRPIDADTRFMLLLAVSAVLIAWWFMEPVLEFVRVYFRGTVFLYGWFIANYPVQLQAQFSGLYVTRPIAHLASVYVLPFVALSVTLFGFRRLSADPIIRNRYLFLIIYVAVLLAMVIAGVIYVNRYLIYLDVIFLILSAPAVVRFVRSALADRAGYGIAGLLCIGFLIHASLVVWRQDASISRAEREEIAALPAIAEEHAFVMATTSHDTPWVLAFAQRDVIDPGYLPWNRWEYAAWQEFWSGKSDVRRHELLRRYDRPIYLFVSAASLEDRLPYTTFIQTDPYFQRTSAHVWRYDPAAVGELDIAAMRVWEEQQGGAR